MSDPFLGMIIQVGFTFAPYGWNQCDGSTLSISQNTALFSLLGTNYGGNGTTTFQLPDLRGRVSVGVGQGPGLSVYTQGQKAGTENTTLLISNLPQHNHTATAPILSAATVKANSNIPSANAVLAKTPDGSTVLSDPQLYAPAGTATPVALSGVSAPTIGMTGSSVPFSTLQPYLANINAIALQGIFPSRN